MYLLFREPVYFTRLFISDPNILPLIKLPDNAWSYALRFLLPDALWCVALLAYAVTIKNVLMRLCAVLMPISMEMAQLLSFVPGTFDVFDLSIYIVLTIITIIYTTRMKKTKITLLVNGLVLALFAAIAMASSSSRDAVDFMDGFSEGWHEGKSYRSDATDKMEPAQTDSISADDKLFASNE